MKKKHAKMMAEVAFFQAQSFISLKKNTNWMAKFVKWSTFIESIKFECVASMPKSEKNKFIRKNGKIRKMRKLSYPVVQKSVEKFCATL